MATVATASSAPAGAGTGDVAPVSTSMTGGQQISARPNERARNKDHRLMRVEIPERIQHLITHNLPPTGTAKYSAEKDASPGDQLTPLPAELIEEPHVTKPYLWVGMVCGNDPKKHSNTQSGRRKSNRDTSVLGQDENTMPVVIPVVENPPTGCTLYVLCDDPKSKDSTRRTAKNLSFDKASFFFFEEFLQKPNEINEAMDSEKTTEAIKANLRYWSAVKKEAQDGDQVTVTDKLEILLADKPLVVTNDQSNLALLTLLGQQLFITKEESLLSATIELCNSMAPGLSTFGPETEDHGIQTFFDFSHSHYLSEEDAEQLIAELQSAHPTMKAMTPKFIQRVHAVLRLEDELSPLVNRSALPFFLEECLANWPSNALESRPNDPKEFAAVKKAVDSTARFLRYANTLTTSDERTRLPGIEDLPDVVGVLAALKDMLAARRAYDDQAAQQLYTQFGGLLQFYDLGTLMAHISRAVDVDSFQMLQQQLGVLMAFTYTARTRKGPNKMDEEIFSHLAGLMGALTIEMDRETAAA